MTRTRCSGLRDRPWLLLPLGIVGLTSAVFFRRSGVLSSSSRPFLPFFAFVPAYAIGVALFFVAERYRLPLFVPLCIGAGAAIDAFAGALAARHFKSLVVPGAAFVVALLLINWRPAIRDGRLDEGLRMAERLITLGRYAEAEPWVSRLVSQAPRPSVVHITSGRHLLLEGRQTPRSSTCRKPMSSITASRMSRTSTARRCCKPEGRRKPSRRCAPASMLASKCPWPVTIRRWRFRRSATSPAPPT